jgi:hypothetical protein
MCLSKVSMSNLKARLAAIDDTLTMRLGVDFFSKPETLFC